MRLGKMNSVLDGVLKSLVLEGGRSSRRRAIWQPLVLSLSIALRYTLRMVNGTNTSPNFAQRTRSAKLQKSERKGNRRKRMDLLFHDKAGRSAVSRFNETINLQFRHRLDHLGNLLLFLLVIRLHVVRGRTGGCNRRRGEFVGGRGFRRAILRCPFDTLVQQRSILL